MTDSMLGSGSGSGHGDSSSSDRSLVSKLKDKFQQHQPALYDLKANLVQKKHELGKLGNLLVSTALLLFKGRTLRVEVASSGFN
jgi:hypothetical protein